MSSVGVSVEKKKGNKREIVSSSPPSCASEDNSIAYTLRSRKIMKPQTPPDPTTQESPCIPTSMCQPPPGSISRQSDLGRIASLLRQKGHNDDADYEHNYKQWISWASKALEHYNLKQNAKFRLVKVTRVIPNACIPRRKVHINFKAKSDDDDSLKLFFSEMEVPWPDKELEAIVHGCCTLEKTDSRNLNARPCSHCGRYEILIHPIHPTRRYGYHSSSGVPFTDLALRY